MGVIRILPDQVANKIAAGEVVERPASVVKELLENALDAGARRIRVEVEAGGRKRIRVIDDGCGMTRDDALLAFERHATSKLRDVGDLEAIATLGFRGEALPAIGAVSRLTLETCLHESGAVGSVVEVAGGRMREVREAGLPPGTAISVEDLFFNVPARRKFLKSEATELGHVATLVTHYALAHPEIRFDLDAGTRTLLAVPPAASHAERMQQVFGPETLAQLLEVTDLVQWPAYPGAAGLPGAAEPASAAKNGVVREAQSEGLAVFGFVSVPEVQKLNRDSMFTFVNRRLVRDRLIQHAISEAYRNLLPGQAYPVVLLFLDMPYSEVDVNVHPAKVEVRFRKSGFVHDAVRDAIRRTLGAARPVPSFLRELSARATARPALSAQSLPTVSPDEPPHPLADESELAADAAPVADAGLCAPATWESLAPEFYLTPQLLPPEAQRLPFEAAPQAQAVMAPNYVSEPRRGCEAGPSEAAEAGLVDLARLRPLGQIHDSFIVATDDHGLWLIDQHVAHERVLFEQVLAARLHGAVERQHLLMPMIVELDPGRWARFAEIAEELREVGFDAEPFGQRTLAIKGTPAGITSDRVQVLLDELLDVPEREQRETSLERLRTRIAATIACHAAIKVNMTLEQTKMEWLLHALAGTRFPMACPHGRPVLLHYSLHEIQRAFKR